MHELNDLVAWDAAQASTRLAIAKNVVNHLSHAMSMTGLRRCKAADVEHEIAFYDLQGDEFALVPGGQITLGVDQDEAGIPTEEDWKIHEQNDPLLEGWTLDRVVREYLTPKRTVDFLPFLIEVKPRDLSAKPIELASVKGVEIPDLSINCTSSCGSMTQEYRFTNYKDEGLRAYEINRLNLVEAIDRVKKEGFTLPTSDQWEYASSGGSRMLYRWGNNFEYHPTSFSAVGVVFDHHDWEFVDGDEILRGSDGGAAECGGCDDLTAELPHASAFRDPFTRDAWGDRPIIDALARRVFVINPSQL